MTKKDAAEKAEGKKGKAGADALPAKSLDEMILNYGQSKYIAIPLIAQWAKVVRKREENRHLTPVELLDLAMKDVLSGDVDWATVEKALANGAADAPEKPAGEKAEK